MRMSDWSSDVCSSDLNRRRDATGAAANATFHGDALGLRHHIPGLDTFSMNRILKDLVNLLNLETLEDNLFRGASRDLGDNSVIGGQGIGQALAAASNTVATGSRASPNASFLRPRNTTP